MNNHEKTMLVSASFMAETGWKLSINGKDVSGYIPKTKLFKKMDTRKYYLSGYRGYTNSTQERKNKNEIFKHHGGTF